MSSTTSKNQKLFLIVTTLIVGLCSIIYELLISTTASYFLGNSIQQFSIIIGIYMAAMGIGSWISRWIDHSPVFYFTIIEIILGIIGAFSVPICYIYFLHSDYSGYNIITLTIITLIGTLTGLEVPLLTRIMESRQSFKNNISTVLTFDYIGALIATLIFPFFLVPFVGLYKSSLIFGMINIVIGILTYIVYAPSFSKKQAWISKLLGVTSLIAIILTIFYSNETLRNWNNSIFNKEVIFQKDSPYQNIVMTGDKNEFSLYLNGALQFSSRDEYRYHESLVHIPLNELEVGSVNNVLMLGGGEGLAAREVLKYKELQSLQIVDIDPEITTISKNMGLIADLNQNALSDPRVEIINMDAFVFLMNNDKKYDAIICDLPDPNSETIARLYSNAFYRLSKNNLKPHGILVTQATSPELTKNAFWCINKTLLTTGFSYTVPYKCSVPSFGMWGFILAKNTPGIRKKYRIDIPMKYLEDGIIDHLSYFPKDKKVIDILPNNLDQPMLLEYYLDHWHSLQGKKR